jgi:hypothetical protein
LAQTDFLSPISNSRTQSNFQLSNHYLCYTPSSDGLEDRLEEKEKELKATQDELERVQAMLKCSEDKLKEKELFELVRCVSVILSALSH